MKVRHSFLIQPHPSFGGLMRHFEWPNAMSERHLKEERDMSLSLTVGLVGW